MDFLKEVVSTIFTLTGLFTLIYFGAYIVELAKQKARRKLSGIHYTYSGTKLLPHAPCEYGVAKDADGSLYTYMKKESYKF